jgi:Spy/CpxP family protein refolding chaperone
MCEFCNLFNAPGFQPGNQHTNHMKILPLMTTSAIALSGLLFLSASAFAEESAKPDKPPGKGPSPEQRLEKMKTNLSLTPEQAESVKGILEETKSSMDKVRQDSSLSIDEKKAKGRELQESSRSKIGAILTPEQKEKMASMPKGPKGDKPTKDKSNNNKTKNDPSAQ